jgi:hypothetical protein
MTYSRPVMDREPAPGTTSAAVYVVTDSRLYLGAVALINSLRLTGWSSPILVVDCGLSSQQRLVLERETLVLPAPEGATPHLLKTLGPLAHPADVMIVIDADIIVTRSLNDLVTECGRTASFMAVADFHSDRFDERWSELLGLGPLQQRRYVNSGFLVAPRGLGAKIFARLDEAQRVIDLERSMLGSGTAADPFYFPDQDALNAILSSRLVERDEVTVLDHKLIPHPPFRGVRIADERSLRCVGEGGVDPFALHHIQRKPWLHALPRSVYSRLLSRLWLEADLPLRLDPDDIPLRLRGGWSGSIGAHCAGALAAAESVKGRLGIRERLATARGRANKVS